MKKFIIILLYVMNNINGMEQQQIVKREPHKWNPKAYEEGNRLQTTTFLNFLKPYDVNFEGKEILSAGCGTGKIENILKEKAKHIHGFDASKDMIDFAQNKYGHINNLSFEHCRAEDFQSQKRYQLAIASFCIHWFDDKKQAFQRINDALELHGELFGTIQTSDNPTPSNLIAFMETMPSIQKAYKSILNQDLPDLTMENIKENLGVSYPSHKECNAMLQETDFEIIKSEEAFYLSIMSEDELTKLQWPIFSSRPFIQPLPDDIKKQLFQEFITHCISKTEKIDHNQFFEKHYTTIIHARKIQK
jgi:trans-aconitate methyltransferase